MQHLSALERLCESRRELVRATKAYEAAIAECIALQCTGDDIAYAAGMSRSTVVRLARGQRSGYTYNRRRRQSVLAVS